MKSIPGPPAGSVSAGARSTRAASAAASSNCCSSTGGAGSLFASVLSRDALPSRSSISGSHASLTTTQPAERNMPTCSSVTARTAARVLGVGEQYAVLAEAAARPASPTRPVHRISGRPVLKGSGASKVGPRRRTPRGRALSADLAEHGRLSRCLPAPEPAAGHLGGGTPTDRSAELCCLVPAEMSLKHAYVPRLGNAALVVSARLLPCC